MRRYVIKMKNRYKKLSSLKQKKKWGVGIERKRLFEANKKD